jgi:hypothetical protein
MLKDEGFSLLDCVSLGQHLEKPLGLLRPCLEGNLVHDSFRAFPYRENLGFPDPFPRSNHTSIRQIGFSLPPNGGKENLAGDEGFTAPLTSELPA